MKTINELKDAVRAAEERCDESKQCLKIAESNRHDAKKALAKAQAELAKAEAFEAEARERGWSPKGERCVELITVEPMTDVQAYEIMNAHINTDIYSPVGINKIIGLIRAVEARGAVAKRVTRRDVENAFFEFASMRLRAPGGDSVACLSDLEAKKFLRQLGVEVCDEYSIQSHNRAGGVLR